VFSFLKIEKTNFSIPTLKLADICYISKGMVANADEKKAKSAFKLQDLLSNTKDQDHSKPFVEGKDINKWLPTSHKWFEWNTDRSPALLSRPTFPELYEQNEKIMLTMVGAYRGVIDTNRLYSNHSLFLCLLWKDLKGVRNKSIQKVTKYGDEKPKRPDLPLRNNLEENSQRFNLKYLLGIINSSLANHYLKATRRNNVSLYPDDWKQLPIADISLEKQKPIIKLVEKTLTIKGKNVKADVTEIEKKIDKLVYELYGLTEEEIKIIEGK
jgi:adenine-specific DNA-methyltransferase